MRKRNERKEVKSDRAIERERKEVRKRLSEKERREGKEEANIARKRNRKRQTITSSKIS